jgi:hypothetical protein
MVGRVSPLGNKAREYLPQGRNLEPFTVKLYAEDAPPLTIHQGRELPERRNLGKGFFLQPNVRCVKIIGYVLNVLEVIEVDVPVQLGGEVFHQPMQVLHFPNINSHFTSP